VITYHTKEGKFLVEKYNDIPFNKLHKEDGPAIITPLKKEWRQNGKLHRLDGPAIIRDNGQIEWYQNGKLHRLDGPAIIWSNGDEEYLINGKIIETLEVEGWIIQNNIDLKTKMGQSIFILKFG